MEQTKDNYLEISYNFDNLDEASTNFPINNPSS